MERSGNKVQLFSHMVESYISVRHHYTFVPFLYPCILNQATSPSLCANRGIPSHRVPKIFSLTYSHTLPISQGHRLHQASLSRRRYGRSVSKVPSQLCRLRYSSLADFPKHSTYPPLSCATQSRCRMSCIDNAVSKVFRERSTGQARPHEALNESKRKRLMGSGWCG